MSELALVIWTVFSTTLGGVLVWMFMYLRELDLTDELVDVYTKYHQTLTRAHTAEALAVERSRMLGMFQDTNDLVGDDPALTPDQKLLIKRALGWEWNDTHREKNLTPDVEERDRLTERLRFIEETVADIEGL